MNGQKKWVKKGLLRLFLILAFLLFTMGAKGGDQTTDQERVFDQAGLFRDREKEELEELIAREREETGMDLAVVTAFQEEGKSAQEYGDDFYDETGLGAGSGDSGALYLIYMDGPGEIHGDYYISTFGEMTRLLTDSRIRHLGETAVSRLSLQDYAGSARLVLEGIKEYADMGIVSGQYNYESETGRISPNRSLRWYEVLAAVGAAGAAALGACLAVVRDYGMKQTDRNRRNADMAYQAQTRIQTDGTPDRLVNQFVTRQRIAPVSNRGGSGGGHSGRSTTHRSSSGRSHGGGGGRF